MKTQTIQSELTINDTEPNCIDTKNHHAKIEVHFTDESKRGEAEELAERIVKAVNMHNEFVELLKNLDSTFKKSFPRVYESGLDKDVEKIKELLQKASK